MNVPEEMSRDERVREEAEAIRTGGGPPVQYIKHVEGECYICDALRLIEREDEEEAES